MKKPLHSLLRFLFCLCLSLVLLPVTKVHADTLTLQGLQEKFPNGAYWNHQVADGHSYHPEYFWVHYGPCDNPGGYSWTACYTHNGTTPIGAYDCNTFDGGTQCCGFARRLAYDAYGSYASTWTTYWGGDASNYMWNSLKPGDVLYYTGGNAGSAGHWVFVTAVNGNAITVGECNIYNGPCQIRWGNVIYKDNISAERVHVAPYELRTVRQDALDYTAKCTKYPTYGVVMITKDGANINDRPCSKATDPNIKILIDGAVGTDYIVTAVYKNTTGNYWYEVNTSLGQSGYIYSGNCMYQPMYDDVVCNGSVPATVAMDGTLTLSGTITAPSTKIQKATITLYKEEGNQCTQYKTLTKDAVNGAIDLSAFSFKLSESKSVKLICKVTVNVAYYNITTEKYSAGSTKSFDIGTVTLNCVNHSYGNWELTTDYTCTKDGEWTHTCTRCGHKETKPETAPGHNWTVANSSGVTCTSPGYTNYSCLNCGEWNAEEGQVTWSDWSTSYPDTSLDRIETKTQYRYRDWISDAQNSQSGYVDYVKSWPSGFNSANSYYATYNQTPKTAYDNDTERLVIESDNVVGYLYWHWCRGRYLDQPYNSYISDEYTSTYWAFHAYYSTTYIEYNSSANAWSASNYSCCQDSYWYFQIPVYRQTYRIEAKSDIDGKWGNWSDWSDNVVSASDMREVETRNLYRYIDSGLADHNWDTPVCTKEPTDTSEGELTYTCNTCSNQKIQILPKLDFKVCDHEETAQYNKVDPTCTKEGYSGDLICSNCGVTVEKGTIIAVSNHTEVIAPGKVATCTDSGLSDGKKCSVCGTVTVVQNIIPARGHSWDDASCTVPKTCMICGVSEGASQGHSWQEATCTVPKTCETCGATDGTTIPHTYDQQKVAPKYLVSEATQTERAVYRKSCKCGEAGEETFTAGNLKPRDFKDVPKTAFYYDAVMWAVENGITTGTSVDTFSPDAICNRGQVVTFLWRAADEPEPTVTENPFTDVKPSDYFYKAVLWAKEKGITTGTSATTFAPNENCNRGQIVTFLSRAKNGQPSKYDNPFVDVPADAYYTNAVLWAVDNKITNGTGDGTTFAPNEDCTRGQVITFLWRAYTK